MRVDVHESGDRHETLARDRGVDRAGVTRPDVDDLVALEHEVGGVEIDMPLLTVVPGHDVVEVRDASGICAHLSLTLHRPDWHDRIMTAKLTEDAKGVYIIGATPFTDEGALDLQSLDTLTDFYLRCGVHGFTLLGMMGEAHKLTADESLIVVNRVIGRAQGRQVIVGVSHAGFYYPQEMRRGADGAMTGFAWPEMLVQVYDHFARGEPEKGEDLFDLYLPLVRHEQQPAIGLALRKEVLFRRGAIKSPRQRAPGSSLSATDKTELDGMIKRLERRLAASGRGTKMAAA